MVEQYLRVLGQYNCILNRDTILECIERIILHWDCTPTGNIIWPRHGGRGRDLIPNWTSNNTWIKNLKPYLSKRKKKSSQLPYHKSDMEDLVSSCIQVECSAKIEQRMRNSSANHITHPRIFSGRGRNWSVIRHIIQLYSKQIFWNLKSCSSPYLTEYANGTYTLLIE